MDMNASQTCMRISFVSIIILPLFLYFCSTPISAKSRSDMDKLCHFWSKTKSQESQNKPFLSIASYLVHLILEGFC